MRTQPSRSIQFDDQGNLRHFLTVDGLTAETLTQMLDTAESFIDFGLREIKKIPLLRGKTVVNLFSNPAPVPVRPLRLLQSGFPPMSST